MVSNFICGRKKNSVMGRNFLIWHVDENLSFLERKKLTSQDQGFIVHTYMLMQIYIVSMETMFCVT